MTSQLSANTSQINSGSDRLVGRVIAILALLLAAYRGLRPPSLWGSMYLMTTVQDGFWRRSFLGILFRTLPWPVDYRFYALWSYAVAAVVLALLVRLAWRSRDKSVAWVVFFSSPFGYYFFHDIGYPDLFVFALFVVAVQTLRQGHTIFSALLMCVALMNHELALLFVVPYYLAELILSPQGGRRWYAVVLLVAAAAPLLGKPVYPEAKIDALRIYALHALGGHIRADFLDIYRKAYLQQLRFNWPILFVYQACLVLPAAIGLLLQERVMKRLLYGAALLSPLLLDLVGTDIERWFFLFGLLTFYHVLSRDEALRLPFRALLPLFLLFCLFSASGLYLFYGYQARSFDLSGLRNFSDDFQRMRHFQIPSQG